MMNVKHAAGSHFLQRSTWIARQSRFSPDQAFNEERYVFAAPGLPAAGRARTGYLFTVVDGVSSGGRGASAACGSVSRRTMREVPSSHGPSAVRPIDSTQTRGFCMSPAAIG